MLVQYRSVHAGGPAADSKKVRPGDILVSVNDIDVEGKTLHEVQDAIQVCRKKLKPDIFSANCTLTHAFRVPLVGQ